ncbi:MAG: hypothetical protein ACR2QM_20455 [Longimicrobiales bacterium]
MTSTAPGAQPGGLIHCDQELGRRLEGAEGQSNADFVDARAIAFPEVGAEWTRIAGTYAMFDGVGSPTTQTFGLGVFEEVETAQLQELEDFFTDRRSDVFHEVSPVADLLTLSLLGGRGYRAIEWSNVLFRTIDNQVRVGSRANKGIRVREIAPGDEDLWAETAARGWSDVAPDLGDYFTDLGKVTAHRKNTHSFLAETAAGPIASGALCLSQGVAVLAGASTEPASRKQGAQLALLESRLRFAVERGCDLAMITTLPGSASQRNAERWGFRVAYTRVKWRLSR